MASYSLSQQWEDITRRRQEVEDREFEAQRAAAHQEVIAQIDGLRTLTSVSAALPVGWPPLLHDPRPSSERRQEDTPELEGQRTPPPQYRQQTSFAAPASFDSEARNAHPSVQIRQLQEEVTQKESRIKKLESDVEAEKNKRRRLQAERHEAVDAQRRASDELGRSKRQLANLDELLSGSIKRERVLESELDSARQEISELKRQVHEERSAYESDMREKERRERRMKERLEDTHWALEDEIRLNRHPAADFPHRQVQVQAAAPSADPPRRARRSDGSMSGRTYISVPKGGNRRAVWIFT